MPEEIERTTVVRDTPERVVEVHRGSSAGWWIAALVAIVAIVAVAFLYMNNTSTQADLQAARDQGIAEANLANAAASAQQAAATAAQASQDAAAGAARATESAAQSAASEAANAVDATADAARDATTTEPEPR
jgi:hypothetical protein